MYPRAGIPDKGTRRTGQLLDIPSYRGGSTHSKELRNTTLMTDGRIICHNQGSKGWATTQHSSQGGSTLLEPWPLVNTHADCHFIRTAVMYLHCACDPPCISNMRQYRDVYTSSRLQNLLVLQFYYFRSFGKPHCRCRALHLGIAQIAIAPPRTQPIWPNS